MKIAFIRKTYTPFGGAENYLATLLKHLSLGTHDVHMLSSNWNDSDGVRYHKVNTLSFNSYLSVRTFNSNVKRLIRSLKPDCTVSFERTNCQDIYRAGDGCHKEWLLLRQDRQSPLRRLSFRLNPLHNAILSLEKECFEKTPVIVANSKMVKDQIMSHYGISGDRIKLIYNGVDLVRFTHGNRQAWREETRKRYGIPMETPLLLFVGSGFERKGLGTAIAALSGLRNDVRLLVAGRGKTRDYAALAQKTGVLDKVIFAGAQRQIERFYAAADGFVLPTIYDPFSNATIEAMASGLAVITTKHNGASEIIEEGVDGLILHDRFDAAELREKLRELISGSESIGEKARKKAMLYPISAACDEFLSLIHSFKGN